MPPRMAPPITGGALRGAHSFVHAPEARVSGFRRVQDLAGALASRFGVADSLTELRLRVAKAIMPSGFLATHATEIHDAGETLLSRLDECPRDDLRDRHFESVAAPIVSLYQSTASTHESVRTVHVHEQGFSALMLVRPQAEALIILQYLTEPHDDLEEIERRVESYLGWIVARQYGNWEMGRAFEPSSEVTGHREYVEHVSRNYEELRRKYRGREQELKGLSRRPGFLSDRAEHVAERHGILDLFRHVKAECSASIHSADYGDRMTPAEREDCDATGYVFNLHASSAGLWAMFLSNLLQLHSIGAVARFFELQGVIRPEVEKAISVAARP